MTRSSRNITFKQQPTKTRKIAKGALFILFFFLNFLNKNKNLICLTYNFNKIQNMRTTRTHLISATPLNYYFLQRSLEIRNKFFFCNVIYVYSLKIIL